jgi:hypothetical protein
MLRQEGCLLPSISEQAALWNTRSSPPLPHPKMEWPVTAEAVQALVLLAVHVYLVFQRVLRVPHDVA